MSVSHFEVVVLLVHFIFIDANALPVLEKS
jgi:hypothetical protein